MISIIKYNDFLLEHKLWYKTIPQLLNWIEKKSIDNDWVWLDTETTGLGGPKKTQLTQISAISTKYNFKSNTFTKKDSFNKKIKLTEDTKRKMNQPDSNVKWVLSFNRYGEKAGKYFDEDFVMNEFHQWLNEQNNPMLVIQNAQFDMNMLNARYKDIKFDDEIFDTKSLIQLYYLPTVQKLSETDDFYKSLIEEISTSTRDKGLLNSSMKKIGPILKIDMTDYHDALKDCIITITMVSKIIDFLKENSDLDIMKYQKERIETLLK